MAMILEGSSQCSICERPLYSRDGIVFFGHFISDTEDPLWRFSDSAMHRKCFLSWPPREEFRARQNQDLRQAVYADQTVFQMLQDGTMVKIPANERRDPSKLWLGQLYHATILAHISTIAAARAIEGKSEIVLEDLEPQVSAHDFLEILIITCYCSGMFGRLGRTRARNFVLDSLFLYIGDCIRQIHGIESAKQYETIRSARLTRYMNQVNNLQHEASPKLGEIIEFMVSSFERDVIKHPMPALVPTILEMLSADEIIGTRYPDFLSEMDVNFGRNSDPCTVRTFVDGFIELDSRPKHFDQMISLLTHYLEN